MGRVGEVFLKRKKEIDVWVRVCFNSCILSPG